MLGDGGVLATPKKLLKTSVPMASAVPRRCHANQQGIARQIPPNHQAMPEL